MREERTKCMDERGAELRTDRAKGTIRSLKSAIRFARKKKETAGEGDKRETRTGFGRDARILSRKLWQRHRSLF